MDDGSVKASVRYKLRAEVTGIGSYKLELCHSQDIRVILSQKGTQSPLQSQMEEVVTFLRCAPKGHVSLFASTNKSVHFLVRPQR